MKSILFCLLLMMALTSCAGKRPIIEYVLAKESKVAAINIKANKVVPDTYNRAKSYYSKAESAFKNYENVDAKVYFIKAKRLFERSERLTKIKIIKKGAGEYYP